MKTRKVEICGVRRLTAGGLGRSSISRGKREGSIGLMGKFGGALVRMSSCRDVKMKERVMKNEMEKK